MCQKRKIPVFTSSFCHKRFIRSKMTFFQLSLMSVFVILSHSAKGENTRLLLVQTLTRHGDKAPPFLYPTDPNSEDDWPNGLSQLTQLGKKQQYDVGKFLRSMYKDFVTSDPKQIFVNSSSEGRCLNSAESNLASFYAPDEKWKFAENFDWQPIPVHYLPPETDIYLNVDAPCPRANEEHSKERNSREIQEFYQKHQTMVENVSKFSGLDISKPDNAYELFNILNPERIHNLLIPEWADKYWEEIIELAKLDFQAKYSSPTLLRLRYGPFLGLINNNLKNKINGKISDLKFVLNFAHANQVAAVLQALNATNMASPPYCATLLFELHELADASKAVRVLYMNSTHPLHDTQQPHVLVLDNCMEFCPVKHFMKSYKWLIPKNWKEECQLDTSDSK